MMKHRLFTHCLAIVCTFLFCRIALAQEYDLRPIHITSNVGVSVTIKGGPEPSDPMYLSSDGTWKDLTVESDGRSVTFTQPADTLSESLVLLSWPEWLSLPDTDAPVLGAVSVEDKPVEAAPEVNLGSIAEIPAQLTLRFTDALNPIAAPRINVLIDGRAPEVFNGDFEYEQSEDGKMVSVFVFPGELDTARHVVTVSVPDATPGFNTTLTKVVFSTAPIIANGDFEQADANGAPLHWSTGTWSATAETKAEFKVVDGGRSGKCLMLNGIAGNLSLVCGQPVELVRGATYLLSGYYKTDANRGYASLIGSAGKITKDCQYDSMPGLKTATDWTPFEWEVTAAEACDGWTIYLRSGGPGAIYFDDVKLEQQR